MDTSFDKLNKVLANRGLRCYQSDSNGNKKITFVGIEGCGFDFKLSLTWHGEVVITDFEGIMVVAEFCKLISELENEMKKLEL